MGHCLAQKSSPGRGCQASQMAAMRPGGIRCSGSRHISCPSCAWIVLFIEANTAAYGSSGYWGRSGGPQGGRVSGTPLSIPCSNELTCKKLERLKHPGGTTVLFTASCTALGNDFLCVEMHMIRDHFPSPASLTPWSILEMLLAATPSTIYREKKVVSIFSGQFQKG